ncbi:uncharacterized protein [Phyllobates terribilis]|uniref:uncharacterized protein n=1 Tax=Phyllobates terribilis TaxID=111132 RepID=UPI003CCB1B57
MAAVVESEFTSPVMVNQKKQEGKKHSFTMSGEPIEVDMKYVPVKLVGEGTDGVVFSCLNAETGRYVAVKKIRNPFRNRLQSMKVLREIQILRQLRHKNIVSINDVMMSSDTNDVYLVQELMDMDLFNLFEFPVKISDPLCRRLLHHTLLGVKYLHSVGVIHRDLKPENLLIEKISSTVKIGDFGHARTFKNGFMMDRVGTVRYNAPELLYGSNRYTEAVDMWSVGCIFGQILGNGEHMFPGTDILSQINEIIRVVGTPSDFNFVENERVKRYLKGLQYSPGVGLRRLFPAADSLAIDLLGKMVEFDPRKRITEQEALRHPYFRDEVVVMRMTKAMKVKLEVDEDDTELVDLKKVKDMIREEVLLYHPEERSFFNSMASL